MASPWSRALLVLLAASCTRGDSARPEERPIPSTAPSAVAPRGLRRLSRREYDAVVRDLLGDGTAPGRRFSIEVYTNGYDDGSAGLTVEAQQLEAYRLAAEDVATRATADGADLGPLVGDCDPTADEAACVDRFFSSFVRRAYRRHASQTELARLRAVYMTGAAAGGFRGGLELALEAILQSPAFLYREELGAGDPSLPRGTVRLTDDEVASELSFMLTGSMPDDALFAAVDSGHLRTAEDRRREAARLLASPAARPAMRSFLHQWLGTDGLAIVRKDPAAYPAFDPELAASMRTELDRYFDDVVWDGSGTLRELFTSTRGFVDARLAALYAVPAPDAPFSPVTLDPATRAGVMTRAGFLAAHADADSSGPVARGVFVLRAMLCEPPAPPPPNVPALPPPGMQGPETTRQRFDAHLSQPFCAGCHARIDGIGFGFEEFDGVGSYRTTENGLPIDASGELLGSDVDGPFVGASALGARLARSADAGRCFAKQAYRWAMGREESPAAKPLLSAIEESASGDGRVTDAFLAIVADPAFVLRTTDDPGAVR